MKYPVAFRIFATLNLIFLIVLFIISIFLFMKVVGGVWFLSAVALAELWLLISSVLWFFGSKRSYSLLLITGITLALLGCAFIALIFNGLLSSNDQIGFIICGSFCLLYALFLLVSLAFKPIRDWSNQHSSKLADPIFSSLFVVLLVAAIGTSYYLDVIKKDFIILESTTGWIDISSSEVIVDFNSFRETDAVVASFKGDPNKEYEATIYFSETYLPESDTAFQVAHSVVFKPFMPAYLRAGENITQNDESLSLFIATFPPTTARRILIKTLAGIPAKEKSSYTLLHSIPLFDSETTSDKFLVEEEAIYDEGGEEYADEPIDDFVILEEADKEIPLAITQQQSNALLSQFARDVIANEATQYYFNRNEPSLEIDNTRIGHYLHFRSLIDYIPGTLNQFLFDNGYDEGLTNYNLNSGIWKLSGINYANPDADDPTYFTPINAKLAQWVRQNMIPKPDDKILDKTAREIYQQVYRHMLWQLASAHEYLDNEGFLDAEATLYRTAMDGENFNGVQYLYNKYESVTNKTEPFVKVDANIPPGEYDYYYLSEPVAIGFWLRRKIDGSEKELWLLVQDVLRAYDTYPFKESPAN